MEPDTTPNPQRFEVFTEIASGKGFKIKNSKYIYFFDKYGGWYDEFNNYYNADGDNEDPPSDEDDDFERVVLETEFYEGGDDDDYYDKMYGGGNTADYDDYDEPEDDEDDDYEPVVKEKPVEVKQETSNTKKKYFAKNQTPSEQKKEQPKLTHVPQTQSPKKEFKSEVKPTSQKPKEDPKEPPKQEKKQPTWAKYQSEMTVFPKKDSFKEWMKTFGFSQNEHFKNLTKVQSKDPKKRFATVEIRSDAFEKVQNKEYEKTKISFEKVN